MLDLLSPSSIGLFVLALGAAIVNGMVGYGFSSIVTPVALVWMTSRVLNPALVLVELGVNVTLLVRERKYIRVTLPRAAPLMAGLLPGVLVGTLALSFLVPSNVKILVYVTLLPLIFLQLVGFRRPIQSERRIGAPLGTGIGFLYSLTTISGPPLALFWRNQGTSKGEFRCAMAQVRVAEASFTTVAYLFFGLFTTASLSLVPLLVLPVVIGIPVGVYLMRTVSRDLFSRLVMAADALFVSFGLTAVLGQMKVLSMQEGFTIFISAAVIICVVAIWSIRRMTDAKGTGEPDERAFGADPVG